MLNRALSSTGRRLGSVWIGLLLGAALANPLAAATAPGRWLVCFPVFVVPSASMEKALLLGDHIVVNWIGTLLGRRPQHGGVMAFRYPPNPREDYVKRVVGIPGDRGDDPASRARWRTGGSRREVLRPGRQSGQLADSRYFGFIRRSDILGRPVLIYGSHDASRIGKRVN